MTTVVISKKGVQGIPGPEGQRGLQGVQGEKGDRGDTGLQGIQGIQGAKGDRGDTGPKGDTGDVTPAALAARDAAQSAATSAQAAAATAAAAISAPIVNTSGTGIPYRIDGSKIDSQCRNFNLTVQEFEGVNGADPRSNVVALLGWNVLGGAQREDVTDGTMHISFEQHFVQGGKAAFEWHVQSMDTAGTYHRPISVFAPKDGGPGSRVSLAAEKFNFKDYDHVDYVQIDTSAKVIDLYSGVYLRSGSNNIPLLQQRNAQNSAYLPLPYYNADDRLVGTAATFVGTTPTSGGLANKFFRVQATTLPVNGVVLDVIGPSVAGSASILSAVGNATGDNIALFANSSNTASAKSIVDIRVGGTSANDPILRLDIVGGARWQIAADNSAADQFVIGTSSPGSEDRLVISTAGDVSVATVGAGLRVKEGSNAKQGVATLVGGTATVANTSVTANSRILLTSQQDGGTPGFLRVSARTAGTSFTIISSSGSDASVVAYQIFEPA